MPGFRPAGNKGDEASQRTTFRPPWVKENPMPMPMPTAPWVPKRRESQPSQSQAQPNKEKPILRKQSQVTATEPTEQEKKTVNIPIQKETKEKKAAASPANADVKEKEKKIPIKMEGANEKKSQLNNKPIEVPKDKKQPVQNQETPNKDKKVVKKIAPQDSIDRGKEDVKRKTVQIQEEPKVVQIPPMVGPPPPPPPPPPPLSSHKPPLDKKALSKEQQMKIEALKSRPRRRPDWTDMMKEVEKGVKLKHIQCNDRSAPVLPKAKAKGQFVYESETDNVHNKLLKEIQVGVRLKKTRTNDRSKPILDGLRKFRRQMTLEEQIVQKSASVADVVAIASQPDELDDIDKVRDDLQSTKQMLALELRNKEALERENKRLMARLLNLEAELEKEKSTRRIEKEKGEIVSQARTADDDKLISKLKEEAAESSKMMKEMEDMYKKTAEELDVTRAKLESAWLQNAQLEVDLKNASQGGPITKQPSSKKLVGAMSNSRIPISSSDEESEEEESEEESETDEDESTENQAAHLEKRIARELKMLTNKHRGMKDRRHTALKEKYALKEQFSKLSKCLKEENKKYKLLQKEVDKMAKLVKDLDEEEEEEEEEPEIEEDETESESESEDEEEEEDSEGELPESAENDEKIQNLNRRIKVYETRLTTLKKSNYLLKANIDRRQDELNRQKEKIISLQEDLNAVLAELG